MKKDITPYLGSSTSGIKRRKKKERNEVHGVKAHKNQHISDNLSRYIDSLKNITFNRKKIKGQGIDLLD